MAHINLLCNTFPPDIGAAPNRLLALAKVLQHHGHKVTVITSLPHYPKGRIHPGYRGKVKHYETIDKIEVYRYWLYPVFNKNAVNRIVSFISLTWSVLLFGRKELFNPGADLFIIQTPPVGFAWLINKTRKLHKKPFILNVSDLWPEAISALGILSSGSILHQILQRSMNRIYTNAEHIFVQSGESEILLKKQFSNKVHLLRTGFDAEKFNTTPSPIPRSSKKRILYFGVLGIAHDLVRILKSIEFEKHTLSWEIIGEGVERPEVQRLSNQYPQLSHTSMLSHPELLKRIYQAQVVLICQGKRIVGTLPSKIYDAMAAGRPILYIGDGEGAELVKVVECGWVVSARELYKLPEILREIENSDCSLLSAMGKKAFDFAWNNFQRLAQIESVLSYINR